MEESGTSAILVF